MGPVLPRKGLILARRGTGAPKQKGERWPRQEYLQPEADPGKAAVAAPPHMETGAPGAGAPIFISIADYLGSIFAPKAVCGRLPASEGAPLTREGALFAHDDAVLSRLAPFPSAEAPFWHKKRLFAHDSAL